MIFVCKNADQFGWWALRFRVFAFYVLTYSLNNWFPRRISLNALKMQSYLWKNKVKNWALRSIDMCKCAIKQYSPLSKPDHIHKPS